MSDRINRHHTVDLVQGAWKRVGFQVRRDRTFSMFVETYGDADEVLKSELRFHGPAALRRYLHVNSIRLASSFLSDLDRHYRGHVDLCSLGEDRTWHASLDDVLALAEPSFEVSWGLSYERADSCNSAACPTLSEAWEVLVDTGALMAVPGNSGSISIGSVILYASWFTSAGIDRGDSHIDPGTTNRTDELFERILAIEKTRLLQTAGLHVAVT